MQLLEFAEIMAYIASGCQKPITEKGVEVYFDALGDLPGDVLRFAAKRTVMEHKYATFPTVAMILAFARQAMRPDGITEGEAWRLAWTAAKNIDPEMAGPYRVYRSGNGTFTEYASQLEFECSKLPPLVLLAMKTFGIAELCLVEKVDVARAQFTKIFAGLVEKDRANELLPVDMRADLAKIREKHGDSLKKIGAIPE